MSETPDRYRRVAQQFTDRVTAVPDDAWENPAPCEGWVARDVVRHIVDNTSFFLGISVEGPSVDEDPVGAWTAVRDATQAALDDPEVAQRTLDTPMGSMTVEQLVGRIGVADLLVHTWDLARATGLDETLDIEEVRRTYSMMEPNEERLRAGGAFGPRVEAPDDADEQARLIAFTGRRP